MKKYEKTVLVEGLLGLADSLKGATKACEEMIARLRECESVNKKPRFLPCPICGEIPIVEVEKGKVACRHGHFGVLMIGYDFGEKETLETLAKEWNKFATTGKVGE